VVDPEPRARATEPRHDLVGDDENPVPATHVHDRGPVIVRWNGRRERGACDRLRDERSHAARSGLADRLVQPVGEEAAARVGMARVGASVLVRRIDVREPSEPRLVRTPEGALAADVERAERVAVIGVRPPDHHRAILAAREVVRPGELQGRLDRFASAAHGVDPCVRHREQRREIVGVRLQRLGRERRAVDVLNVRDVVGDGVDDSTVAVPDVHDDRPARTVEVPTAVGVLDPHALGANGRRQRPRQHPVEHVAHFRLPASICLTLRRAAPPPARGPRRSRSRSRGSPS
jgi:hypothetical protein